MIIEIDNIELNYNVRKILSGIYFKNEIGTVTGILGRNGCGKSSLLKIIFGSLKPKYKLLRLDKKPILKPFFKTGLVKYLPQHSLLPTNMRFKDAFFLMGVDWFLFIEHFPNFEKYKNAKPKQVSGGELRIIETFLILKSPARFVLLDEPFSHIAPIYIEKFVEIIVQEKQRKGIIITDHLYEHIVDISDNLYLLKGGHTIQVQSKEELTAFGYITNSF